MFKKLFQKSNDTSPEQPTADSQVSTPDKSKRAVADNQAPANKVKAKHSTQPRRTNTKPAKVVEPWDIAKFPVPEIEGKTRFHDLFLEPEIMHAVADLGFEYCSPIQAQSLPHTLKGNVFLVKQQPVTGKPAAF